MFKTIGTTTHREHELGDELLGTITTIAAGLREPRSSKGGLEPETIQYPFHLPHAAPGGDFFVGKTKVKSHHCPALKSRSLDLAENNLTVLIVDTDCCRIKKGACVALFFGQRKLFQKCLLNELNLRKKQKIRIGLFRKSVPLIVCH